MINNRIAKKIRQMTRRRWREFYDDVLTQPFGVRWRIAWYIITHKKGGR